MASNTMDTADGGAPDDGNIARSSSCPPVVGANMVGDSFERHDSPEGSIHTYRALTSPISGNNAPVDDAGGPEVPDYNTPDHEAPRDQAFGNQAADHFTVDYHRVADLNLHDFTVDEPPVVDFTLDDITVDGSPAVDFTLDDITVDGSPAVDFTLDDITVDGSPVVDFTLDDITVDDQMSGQNTPGLYIGVGDVNEQGKPDTYMEVDGADPHLTAGDSPLHAITICDTPLDNQFPKSETDDEVVFPQTNSGQKNTAPAQMHKFTKFPAEIRLMIWEMAMAEANKYHHPYPIRSVQRFRFNLTYDARRVKPGQDKSRGWVACFTPLRINANPPLVFLRAAAECRAILLRKMDCLTVHELPVDQNGQKMAPRKCHMPFDFANDDFCLEGISHALEKAQQHKQDKDAVWDPRKLPLADLLDNALGLRFAPRIKRMVIIPHHWDVHLSLPGHFMGATEGRNIATLAKRFPALVTIKSAIPQKNRLPQYAYSSPPRGFFFWKSACLRGRGKGGPSRMSEEDREALYVAAWQRIFDNQFWVCLRDLTLDLYNGCDCILGR